MLITDPLDPRVADYVGLTDSARRMLDEPAAGFFIAEGDQVIRRAAAGGYPPRSVLVSPQRLEDLSPQIRALDCPILTADYPLLKAITGFHVHRGVLGSFGRLPPVPVAEVLTGARRVVVLEGLNNATNLGAVFRSAAGLGMDAVLLSRTCCDPLYRRAVRVSMGEVFSVPWAFVDNWPGPLADLAEKGFRVLALTPDEAATSLRDVVLAPHEQVALLLGAEGTGLTEDAMVASTERVRIPMAAGVDSLNVGAAAAVAFWAVAVAR